MVSIKNKQILYKKFFLSNNELGKWYNKKYANKLNRVKNSPKKKKKLLQRCNYRKKKPKDLWKFINLVIPSERSVSPPPTKIKVDNTQIANPDEIAEPFNNYFVEIGHLIVKSVSTTENPEFKSFLKSPVSQTIVLEPPQPMTVFIATNSLNLHKAFGYDNISFFLRLGNEILAPILSVYFGLVFELGFFLQIFKTAKVVPIFKAGDKHLVRNYRPISLLSCLSKVLEKVIKNRCISFFEKHEIFYDFQYGFREKRGVMHALLDVITRVCDVIERNKFTALLLMDLHTVKLSIPYPTKYCYKNFFIMEYEVQLPV